MIEIIFILTIFAEILVTTSSGAATTNLACFIHIKVLLEFDVGHTPAGGAIAIILANIAAIFLVRIVARTLKVQQMPSHNPFQPTLFPARHQPSRSHPCLRADELADHHLDSVAFAYSLLEQGLFWAKLSAASTMAITPILVLGWLSQNSWSCDLTFGAVK